MTLRGSVKKDAPVYAERSVAKRSLDGTELGTVALEPSIFGVPVNPSLLHQVVTAQLAAKRAGTQSTKTRAEVSGGGRKPFRQKGTGNARQGSSRAPQYPGGGVALGPKPRSYAQATPKKMIRAALHAALSDRAGEERVALVDGFAAWDVPVTKTADATLTALGLSGKVLVVLHRDDEIARRSFRNLINVKTIDVGELNAYDVLDSDWVLFTEGTLPRAKETANA